VAVLALKDPSFNAAVERRGIPARKQNLAITARHQTLALPLTCVARIVLAIVGGIVAGLTAATISTIGFSRKTIVSMLKKYAMNFHPDKSHCRTDLSEERKEELRKHWLRCSAVKTSNEDGLTQFIYNKALE